MRRLLPLCPLLACLAAPTPAHAAPQKPPKLAVVVVIDQFGFDTLTRMRKHFGKGGIERILTEGAFFKEAHYSHLSTYTGPGHACIASGSYGYKNGIVANKFYDRSQKKSFTMLGDVGHPLLEAKPDPEDDTSPLNFTGESLGDRLRSLSDLKAKVVAIATKDRAAVMLGGRLGEAYWFSEQTGKMTTSTYYAKELPAWVKAFNEKKLVEASFNKTWERALPEAEYAGKDEVPYEDEFATLGKTFPRVVNGKLDKPGPAFYSAFTATPFANDYEVAFAKAAVEGEGLGKDDVTDLLGISFTATDYVGHAYGPDSHEVQDMVVRVDRAIADLLTYLEKAVGGKQHLVVGFTADHGGAPAPERMAGLGYPAGRIKKAAIKDAINAELRARFGEGEWVVAIEDPSVYLSHALIEERKADPVAVQEVAGRACLKIPGFAAYFTRSQLEAGQVPATPLARAAQLSFHPFHSGDVLLVAKPFYLWGKYGEKTGGSTHGSPYRYDTHVPMAFWGAGIKAASLHERADLSDFAPTLAALLGVSAPAAADGFARAEVFR